MIYDDHQEMVAVTVSDNGNGTMTVLVEYSGETEEERGQPPVFTNKVKPGELTITKTLTRWHDAGPATFVFQVEGVDDIGNTVYSNVTTLDFDAAGTRSVTLHGVPVGAKVTVTEVYSGSSYQLMTEKEQETVVLSPEAEGAPAGVSFTNDYDVTNEGGHGILNRYDAAETDVGYDWRFQE